jgi:hypothetical protein
MVARFSFRLPLLELLAPPSPTDGKRVRPHQSEGNAMSRSTPTPDQLEAEDRLRAETELLGTVHAINDGLRGLANVVEFESQKFGERLGLVERRQCQLDRVLQQIVAHLGEQQDRSDWWRQGGTPE